ncbi:MAG: phosphatase PAP2 family protein [Ruminococcaceae bacterium]|nr:phosphatase PAP2 family protein [Oscillospiraceae bacterium]
MAVCFIDVKPIGPQTSNVGFAELNGYFHRLTGVNISLYVITDWLSIIPICFVVGFALLGLIQWIKRRSLSRVDYSLFALGGFYIVVMAVFVLFEVMVVNYRPILIEGVLEASYPSSTTMLVMCIMPTSLMQLNERINNKILKNCVLWSIIFFTAFMVLARLFSGVHWLTDIIGGVLVSAGLVTFYCFVVNLKK